MLLAKSLIILAKVTSWVSFIYFVKLFPYVQIKYVGEKCLNYISKFHANIGKGQSSSKYLYLKRDSQFLFYGTVHT